MKRLLLTISLLFPSALAQTDTGSSTDPAGTTSTGAGVGEAGNGPTGRDQDFEWGLLGLLGLRPRGLQCSQSPGGAPGSGPAPAPARPLNPPRHLVLVLVPIHQVLA